MSWFTWALVYIGAGWLSWAFIKALGVLDR